MLASFFSKYAIYGLIAVVLIGVGTTAILQWKSSIRQEALAEYNRTQLAEVLTEQKQYQQQMDDLKKIEQQSVEDLSNKIQDTNSKIQSVNDFLNSDAEKKKDQPLPKVLQDTIQKMIEQGILDQTK